MTERPKSSGRPTDAAPPSGILETCLYVDDLPRARDFYVELFGYRVMDADDRFCAFDVGGAQVLILFLRGSSSHGLAVPHGSIPAHDAEGALHVAFKIPPDRLDVWRRRLADQGITIESTVSWPAGGESMFFRDPDGNLLELVTPRTWPNY